MSSSDHTQKGVLSAPNIQGSAEKVSMWTNSQTGLDPTESFDHMLHTWAALIQRLDSLGTIFKTTGNSCTWALKGTTQSDFRD